MLKDFIFKNKSKSNLALLSNSIKLYKTLYPLNKKKLSQMKNTWRFKGNELKYLKEVIGSGEFSSTSGDMNKRLEAAFCEKYGSKYAVTFNSGTSTLHASLVAANIGYGDEVIQPALTVISNLQSTLAVNAVPVFADIDLDTFNIDVEDIKKKITPKTKAIQVVPLYGLPCNFDEIMEIAKNHNLIVINDAAEAVGAKYKNKDMAICGHIASFSFENSKHLTTGDGGIITTNSDSLALEARSFCNLGSTSVRSGDGRIRDAKDQRSKDKFQNPNYQRCDSLGLNYRMPEVAAAIGLAQLEKADLYVKKRINIANMYLDCIDNCEWLVPQKSLSILNTAIGHLR